MVLVNIILQKKRNGITTSALALTTQDEMQHSKLSAVLHTHPRRVMSGLYGRVRVCGRAGRGDRPISVELRAQRQAVRPVLVLFTRRVTSAASRAAGVRHLEIKHHLAPDSR